MRVEGSILPKAGLYAITPAIAAFFFKLADDHNWIDVSGWKLVTNSSAYSSFTWTVGFLLVFRTSQCYSRFWSCATGACTMRAQMFESAASLSSFCVMSNAAPRDIEHFKCKLVQLFSMLHAVAMAAISDLGHRDFKIIDVDHMPARNMRCLQSLPTRQRVEVVYQWINGLIIGEVKNGLLNVPPPILSRVFQEMEKAMIEYNQVVQIMTLPFPFPYSQVCFMMIVGHVICTPIVMCYYTSNAYFSMIMTFLASGSFFALELIAAELENPFGDDTNDLPSYDFQEEINEGLLLIIDPVSNMPFDMDMHASNSLFSRKTWHSMTELEADAAPVKIHELGDEIEPADDEEGLDQKPPNEAQPLELSGPDLEEGSPTPAKPESALPEPPLQACDPLIPAPRTLNNILSNASIEGAVEIPGETPQLSSGELLRHLAILPEPKWIEQFIQRQETLEKELLNSLSDIKDILEKTSARLGTNGIGGGVYFDEAGHLSNQPSSGWRQCLPRTSPCSPPASVRRA